MSQLPTRSRWPRLLATLLLALLVFDAVVLAAAARIPAVQQSARQFAPVMGSLVRAATVSAMAAGESRSSSSYFYSTDDAERGLHYLIAEPDGEHGWNMIGTYDDRRMSQLKHGAKAFVWFEDESGEYLLTDAATIARARVITADMRRLGSEQGRIGAAQGLIGTQQGLLGARQGLLGAKIGALAERTAAASVSGDDAAAERAQRDLDRAQREMEAHSRKLDARMEPLSREQERLGRIQTALGEQQEAAQRKADLKMRELFKEVRQNGKAVRLHADA